MYDVFLIFSSLLCRVESEGGSGIIYLFRIYITGLVKLIRSGSFSDKEAGDGVSSGS
jgi:hypothetical protein